MGDRTVILEAEVADRYLDELSLCVECAGLNDLYPPSEALLDALFAMMPSTNRMLFPKVELNGASGLPTYKEFVRVAADRACAREELPRLVQWKDAKGDGIYDTLSCKYRYYKELLEIESPLVESKKVYFRKIDKASSSALFRIVLDRITLQGTLERLTVELRQRHGLWSKGTLTVDDLDAAAMSESLEGMVYRTASKDVEVIFLCLNEDPSIETETVTKGIIGPYLAGVATPETHFAPVAPGIEGGSVLTLSLSTASAEQKIDVFNDPFQQTPRFSMEARKDLEQRRGRIPYHVLTDRKFVVYRSNLSLIKKFLEEAGTNNIIYEANHDNFGN